MNATLKTNKTDKRIAQLEEIIKVVPRLHVCTGLSSLRQKLSQQPFD
jgi:hypothetical protein